MVAFRDRTEPGEVRLHKRIELRIDGVAADGAGVGRSGGRVVFVPYSIPGERLIARVTHLGSRRAKAVPLKILEPSPDRVDPVCPVFGRCGGCQLMHLDYPAQLRLKQALLNDTLRSVAGLVLEPQPPVLAAPHPLGYRNRGQYPVASQQGRVVTGFFETRSHRVVAVDRCRIHHPRVDQAVACVRAWANRQGYSAYGERSRFGFLRHVVARVARGTGEVLVALVAREDRGSGFGGLVRMLKSRVPGVVGLVLNINGARTNVILGKRSRLLWGLNRVEERFGNLRFGLSLGSFFQVNAAQAEALFLQVRDFLSPPAGPVVDAYCGVGVLGLMLAAVGHTVRGIELSTSAVEEARLAARENRLDRATFHPGRVEKVLPRLLQEGLRPASVVLDPPRKGCATEVLDAVAASEASRVAYLSCHPGTLARDLARLLAGGFRLETLKPVDMFPQTSHLEVFAGLVRG